MKLDALRKSSGSASFRLEGCHRVLPFTISIEGPDGISIPLIRKGARLPARHSQVFTTFSSFQMSAFLHIVIGERDFANDNETLCVIRYDEGSFRMAGKARYELSVRVSGDGRILVRTENLDRARGSKGACISFENEVISLAQIARVQRSAESHASQDAVISKRFELMKSLRERIEEMDSELWPAAKRKMSWAERKSYRALRKHVWNLLELGPSEVDDAQFEEMRRVYEVDLDRFETVLLACSNIA